MNHAKLRGRIYEYYGTVSAFALDMGTTCAVMSRLLNGKTEWNVPKIRKACMLLHIEPADIPQYFFCAQS